ncbi:MAG: response regulator, partial [Chromatiaceae bacterium]
MNTGLNSSVNPAAPRLLIADDEPLLRRHLQALLAEFWPEAQTTLAEDGAVALTLCQQQQFDVAFLDIQMPGLDGLQLLRELRRLPAPPLVVFSTAYNQHAVSAFELEAVDYLLKPLEEARLQQCITRLQQRLS